MKVINNEKLSMFYLKIALPVPITFSSPRLYTVNPSFLPAAAQTTDVTGNSLTTPEPEAAV